MCAEISKRQLFFDFATSVRASTGDSPSAKHQGDDFAISLMALSRQKGVGAVAIRALFGEFTDPAELWVSDPSRLSSALGLSHVPSAQALAETILDKRSALLQEGKRELEEMRRLQIQIIGRDDPKYPRRLLALRDAPYWLFVDGLPEIMNRYQYVAIVGTREATTVGKKAAQTATMVAGESGFGLVSGLAEGIDAAAHEMASRFEMPQVGILGTGIRVIFPKSTSHLRRSIIETGGTVITECLPNENYGKSQFVQRNRLQAALATVVAPIEGQASSGTAHTLRFSQELDRPLVALSFGQANPENAILHSLTKYGTGRFDLSLEEDRERFRGFLSQFPGERWPHFQRPDASILFRRVRNAWKDVSQFTEATDSEKLRLVELFLEDLGLGNYQVVKKRDDSGDRI
jgi:DNA protecting protein DprA